MFNTGVQFSVRFRCKQSVRSCTLLQAIRLLIKRGIPACFIRTLVYMYFGHSVRVLWAGISSTYFQAPNGVKQGGVISPLFCSASTLTIC